MGSICIVLKRHPYGTVDAAEAIRHALGGVTQEMDVRLVLLAGGVNAARRGHDMGGTSYLSIEDGIKDCIDMGVVVTAEKEALAEAGITGKLIDGVEVADSALIAGFVKESDTVMLF
jgi:sulfur relay (sulfurtransferase) complex TusBCD TusD component (DsrE family)